MSLIPFLAYLAIANPAAYKATRGVFGTWVSSPEGAATFKGLLLHALFFLFILYLVGRFMPRISGFSPGSRGLNDSCSKKSDCASGLRCKLGAGNLRLCTY